jgi:hypothetical protein
MDLIVWILAGLAVTNILMEVLVALVGAAILLAVFPAPTHRGILHA